MGKRAVDHDRWLASIQATARAENLDKRDKKDYSIQTEDKKCTNCGSSKNCRKFNGKVTYTGSYSIGGDAEGSVCNKWTSRKEKVNTKQASEIKSLMKQFKKNLKS